MISKYWHFILKQIKRDYHSILIVSGIAITIGLLVSMSLIYYGMKVEIDRQALELYGEKDVMVGYKDDTKARFSNQDIEYIENHTGTKKSSTVFYPLFEEGRNGMSYIGIDQDDQFVKDEYGVKTESLKAGEIIITSDLIERFDAKDDKITITFPAGEKGTWTIKEIIEGRNTAIFNVEDLQNTLDSKDQLNLMIIDLKDNTDKDSYIANISENIDSDLIIDPLDAKEEYTENLGALRNFAIAFGVLLIFISASFVKSILQITFTEKIYQISILRTIGANRKQIFLLVIIEGLILSLIGSLIGITLGILLANLGKEIVASMLNMSISNLSYNWTSIILIVVLTLLVILLAILTTANKTAKLPPIHAISSSTTQKYQTSKAKLVFYKSILLLGAVLFVISLFSGELSFIGTTLLFIGILLNLEFFIKVFFNLLKYLFRNNKYFEIKLAINNIIANGKQMLNTIRIIILIIVIGFSFYNLLVTIEVEEYERINNQFGTELVVQSYKLMGSTLPISLEQELESIPGVKEAVPLGKVVGVDTDNSYEISVIPSDFQGLSNIGLLPSEYANLSEPAIIITEKIADETNLKVGDEIKLSNGYYVQVDDEINQTQNYHRKFGFEDNTVFKVIDVVDFAPGALTESNAIIDWKDLQPLDDNQHPLRFFIETDRTDGTDGIEGSIKSVLTRYPEAELMNRNEQLEESNEQVAQRFAIVYVAILSALVVGFLGMYNSLNSSILFRRKEHGILRATVLTPNNLSKVILIEGILLGVFVVIVGNVAALLINMGLSSLFDVPMVIEWINLLFIDILVIILTMFISLVPSLKLRKNKVVDFFK